MSVVVWTHTSSRGCLRGYAHSKALSTLNLGRRPPRQDLSTRVDVCADRVHSGGAHEEIVLPQCLRNSRLRTVAQSGIIVRQKEEDRRKQSARVHSHTPRPTAENAAVLSAAAGGGGGKYSRVCVEAHTYDVCTIQHRGLMNREVRQCQQTEHKRWPPCARRDIKLTASFLPVGSGMIRKRKKIFFFSKTD